MTTPERPSAEVMKACCREIVDWRNSGLLRDGELRKLATTMVRHDEHDRLRAAENLVLDWLLHDAARPAEAVGVAWEDPRHREMVEVAIAAGAGKLDGTYTAAPAGAWEELAQRWDKQADECEAEAKRLGDQPVAREIARDAAQYRQCAYQLRRTAALAALPGGGVEELVAALRSAREWHRGDKWRKGSHAQQVQWQSQMDVYDDALRPFHHTPTPNPHEADRNG